MNERRTIARLTLIAGWILPSCFCLWLYWFGLHTWFLQDDFAWLGLNVQIHDARSFWHAVFVPANQGTIRPLSERLFFIAFWRIFGWDAFWYRAAVFATQFFNLVLLSAIVWRLTGSRLAAFLAPMFWTANAALTVAMSWSSGYNEVLCGAFLLSSFALLLRFQETARWRYYWAQVCTFLIGFGALELNIVYPAIALCWAILRVRDGQVPAAKLALSTVPLFVLSAAYYAIHALASPPQTAGPYAMHFDGALAQSFWTYCQWVFVAPLWQRITQLDPRLGLLAFWIPAAALLAFILHQAWHGKRLPLFFLTWFVVTLAPLIPLRDHLSDYYLSIPALGIGVVGALAVSAAWRGPVYWKVTTMLLAGTYLAVQIPVARAYTLWHKERSAAVRDLVLGVERAHQLHPGKTILLTDVSSDLYATAIAHQPFRLIPGARVYLAPQAVSDIVSEGSNLARVSQFVMPAGATGRALNADQLEVYSAATSRLRNITALYWSAVPREWITEFPRFIDVGSPFVAYAMGPSWYPSDGAYRWMPRQATVEMKGPPSGGKQLFLHGYCARQLIAHGPAKVTVSVDGNEAGNFSLTHPDFGFDASFPLPLSSIGRPAVEVQVQVDRTFEESPGGRALGLAFGTFEIR